MFSPRQCVFPPSALVSPTQSKDMQVWWIGYAELAVGVCVSAGLHQEGHPALNLCQIQCVCADNSDEADPANEWD